MKLLLSLSIIPLLLLTNVSAAVDLQLPLYDKRSSSASVHEYENPTTYGFPIVAITADENDNADSDDLTMVQIRAQRLCILLGHQGAGRIFEQDIRYEFNGEAYLEGEIVEVREQVDGWSFLTLGVIAFWHTNAIFKTLRCVG